MSWRAAARQGLEPRPVRSSCSLIRTGSSETGARIRSLVAVFATAETWRDAYPGPGSAVNDGARRPPLFWATHTSGSPFRLGTATSPSPCGVAWRPHTRFATRGNRCK